MNSEKKSLLFLIDVTGSMGNWIGALVKFLPTTIRSMALTRVFDQVAIFPYTDYDHATPCKTSGYVSCDDLEAIKKLHNFAANLRATGGGGRPEAWKTALEFIQENSQLQEGKLFIIHLTDAAPHVEGKLDKEGKQEKAALGSRFEFFGLMERFLTRFPSLHYSCLATCCHPFYCYLAQKTGGSVHELEGATSSSNIITQISRIFNGWFGFPDPCGSRNVIATTQFSDETELAKFPVQFCSQPIFPDKLLSNAISSTIQCMKSESLYLEHIFDELKEIIEENPMSLTISPILGKMWRELCKRRCDIRRDELITLLSKRKKGLLDSDIKKLDEWLKESYNSAFEITEDLKIWLGKNPVKGLLRFVPEENYFCAQQLVQLLASGNRKSTAIIRSMLTRMYIDKEFQLESKIISEDDDLPLPDRSIPLNLPLNKIFELGMHTVAPGTKFTLRYSAMLALHSIQCGSVLSELAKKFLEKNRGRWINWKRRDDGTVEVPDCWSFSFLKFLLHPTCSFALTKEETQKANFYLRISYALRFYRQLEVPVKTVDPTSIDGSYPDHQRDCPRCNYSRPLTMFAPNGICGLCLFFNYNKFVSSYDTVRCYGCDSLYGRDVKAFVEGNSKCYGCRKMGNQIPPRSQCKKCNLYFIHYMEGEIPHETCGPCQQGMPPRVLKLLEKPAYAHQIIPSKYFPLLCENIGLKVDQELSSSPTLYDVVSYFTEITPIIHDPPENIRYLEKLVENIDEIWSQIIQIMAGTAEPENPECDICMESFHPGQIIPACGRRGCNQRICVDCSKLWYSKNTPGNLIYQRATMCQFCCRVPAPRTLGRVDVGLIALASSVSANKMDPDAYYGWCSSCFGVEEIGRHDCNGDEPNLVSFVCSGCKGERPVKEEIRECPGCTVATQKISGCNHIYCTSCSTHWCWECGVACTSAEDTYDHMSSVHGRMFDDDPYFSEDEG